MRWALIGVLLLSCLPGMAQRPQSGRVMQGEGLLYILVDEAERVQPRAPVGHVYPVEQRVTGLKGPVRRVSVKAGKEGDLRTRWVEEYDRAARITCHISYNAGHRHYKRLTYYAAAGGRTDVSLSSAWKWVREYDARGRLLSEVGQWVGKDGKLETRTRNRFTYDADGREVAWERWSFAPITRPQPEESRGTRRLDADGKLLRVEQQDGQLFRVAEYRYDARGNVTVERVANRGIFLEETRYTYNATRRLLKRETVDADGQRLRALILTYDANGRLLTREEYGWDYQVWRAKDGVDHRSTPMAERKVDAPLRLRTVHTYDAEGRLLKTAHYDGDGKPCYQPIPTSLMISGTAPPTFSFLQYAYDDGKPRWTAYHPDGSEVHGGLFFRRTAAQGSAPRTPPTPQVKYDYDQYGNAIREESNGYLTVREITYH